MLLMTRKRATFVTARAMLTISSLSCMLCLWVPTPVKCQDQPRSFDPADPITWPPLVEPKSAALHRERFLEGHYGIPQVADVSKIVVEITSRDPDELKSFELPASEYEKILSKFGNAEIDRDPNSAMPEVASLKIWTKDRLFRRVCVFGAAQTSFCFSVQGVRCRVPGTLKAFHDPSMAFIEKLLAAEVKAKQAKGGRLR
jgi:hypothetical protein